MGLRAVDGKPVNVWIADSAGPWNILEVPNVGRARTKSGGISSTLCTACRKKFYCKPVVPLETRPSESVPFSGSNAPDNKKPQMGNPHTENWFHPPCPT